MVTLDAIVRTDKGAHLGGLRPEDFTVYDNDVAQDITLFSREQFPVAAALVFDTSPSIQPYLAQLRGAALTVLGRLKPEDEVALFTFGANPSRLSDLTRDRARIAEMVGRVPGDTGGTKIYDAIYDAAVYLQSQAPDSRHAIILISDNFQTIGSVHTDVETLQKMLEGSVRLFSIKTSGVDATNGLLESPRRIADISERTGGEVLTADAENELAQALDAVFLNLKAGYVLGFTPSDLGPEGSYHRLAMGLNATANCPKCRIQARSGYFAAGIATLPPLASAANEMEVYQRARTVVDLTPRELLQNYGDELRDLELAENQEALDLLLRMTGENVERFFRDIPNTIAREQVRRERLRFDGSVEESVTQNYNYTAHLAGLGGWEEARTDTKGRDIAPELMSRQSFLTSGFAAATLYFHPQHQFGCRFRYLGRQRTGPRNHVIAFAQKPGIADVVGHFLSPFRSVPSPLLYQGFVWVDPSSYQIVRLRQNLLAPLIDVFLTVASSDISYSEVRFQSVDIPFWLPQRVVVDLRFAGQRYRNRHTYSDYQVFTVAVEQKIIPPVVKK